MSGNALPFVGNFHVYLIIFVNVIVFVNTDQI